MKEISREEKKLEMLKEYASSLGGVIEENCPQGQGRSLALMKLQECFMWATNSIVVGDKGE